MLEGQSFRTSVVLLLIMVAGLSACSRSTPLCAYGDALAKQANLTPASDAYAEAERNGEGDCADDGLEKVTKDLAAVKAGDAKGRAALRAGDTAAAKAAFEDALKTDRGDAVATVELQRLGAVVPSAPATPPPLVVTAARPSSTLAWIGIALALVMAVLTAAFWWWMRRRVRAVDTKWEQADRKREHDFEQARRPLNDESSRLVALSTALAGAQARQRELAGEIRELSTELTRVREQQGRLTTTAGRHAGELSRTTRVAESLTARVETVVAESALHRRQLESLAALMIEGRPGRRTERFGQRLEVEDDRG